MQQLPPCRQVCDVSFYRLAQFCTIALYHCDQVDDHCVARALMNISFAFCNDSSPATGALSPCELCNNLLRSVSCISYNQCLFYSG